MALHCFYYRNCAKNVLELLVSGIAKIFSHEINGSKNYNRVFPATQIKIWDN